jgi:catechol 2,3-dioxygenase-like lactoylglutathione lyase family enzyme
MSNSWKIVSFVAVRDTKKSRPFYEGVLGLRFVSEDRFALVLDANGTMLRVTNAPADFKPHNFTVLGWEVADIEKAATTLREKGVHLEIYGFPGQDANGIWSAPGGAKVAWFQDPDGNLLSISQHP